MTDEQGREVSLSRADKYAISKIFAGFAAPILCMVLAAIGAFVQRTWSLESKFDSNQEMLRTQQQAHFDLLREGQKSATERAELVYQSLSKRLDRIEIREDRGK